MPFPLGAIIFMVIVNKNTFFIYLHSQNLGLRKNIMANHKSALKRIRQTAVRTERNKYVHKTTRNAVRKLRTTTKKKEAEEMLPKVSSLLDKLAKNNIIHKKKAANLKSKLAAHVNSL